MLSAPYTLTAILLLLCITPSSELRYFLLDASLCRLPAGKLPAFSAAHFAWRTFVLAVLANSATSQCLHPSSQVSHLWRLDGRCTLAAVACCNRLRWGALPSRWLRDGRWQGKPMVPIITNNGRLSLRYISFLLFFLVVASHWHDHCWVASIVAAGVKFQQRNGEGW